MWEQEIHSLINATFVPRPVRCTYHVARSELCLLHKPHQINIPSRPRSSNGLILAILPNGKHAPRPLRARFRSTVPSLAGVARSWRAPCTRLAWADSSAELGPSKGEAAETFARDASGSRPAQDAPVHARPGEFRPVWSGARPIMASRFLGCSQAPTDPLNAPSGRRRGGG